MINIYIHSTDTIWSSEFRSYVNNFHSKEFCVFIDDDIKNIGMIDNASPYGVHLIDESIFDGMDISKDDFMKCHTDEFNYILLTEYDLEQENFSISKYTSADVLIGKIKKLEGSMSSSNTVKHYVIAAAMNSQITWKKCVEVASVLSKKSRKVLIISFAYSSLCDADTMNDLEVDVFSKFVYYASISCEKLILHFDSVMKKHSSGATIIPKPYLFDVSQWNEQCSMNTIKAIDGSDDFDIVIWHMDGIYTQGFIPIYKRCDRIFWTGSRGDNVSDLSLKVLSDICNKNLEDVLDARKYG